jgi:hypothetical protein
MRRFALCTLSTVLALALSSPAHAAYRDGALGFFIVLYSVPVAIGGLFCTLLLWSLQLFKRGWVMVLYGVVFIAAALVAAWLSLSAHDPTSLLFVVIGESILLVPVLLPAVLQYLRSRKRRAGGPWPLHRLRVDEPTGRQAPGRSCGYIRSRSHRS